VAVKRLQLPPVFALAVSEVMGEDQFAYLLTSAVSAD
jgi:hypothetical protein